LLCVTVTRGCAQLSSYFIYDNRKGFRLVDTPSFFVSPAGEYIAVHDMELIMNMDPATLHQSPRTYIEYPTRCVARCPSMGLDIELTAVFGEQEQLTVLAWPGYWEGRMKVRHCEWCAPLTLHRSPPCFPSLPNLLSHLIVTPTVNAAILGDVDVDDVDDDVAAVQVEGTNAGKPVTGLGFLERTSFNRLTDSERFFKAVGKVVRARVCDFYPTPELSLAAVRRRRRVPCCTCAHPWPHVAAVDVESTLTLTLTSCCVCCYQAERIFVTPETRRYLDGVDLRVVERCIVEPVRSITDRGGKAWRSFALLGWCVLVTVLVVAS
jgi:hypothetical protein